MKKSIKLFLNTIVFSNISIFFVNAQSVSSVANPLGCNDIATCIKNVGGFVTPLAILGFFACVVYAGFVRLTATGNSDQEAKSIKIATSAAIGFAIIALSPLVIRLVMVLVGVDPKLVF